MNLALKVLPLVLAAAIPAFAQDQELRREAMQLLERANAVSMSPKLPNLERVDTFRVFDTGSGPREGTFTRVVVQGTGRRDESFFGEYHSLDIWSGGHLATVRTSELAPSEIETVFRLAPIILSHLDESFLGSREEKIQLFTKVLAISPIYLPVTRRSNSPFTDQILISYDKETRLPRFVFVDEGARSLARFERFLSGYDRLFRRLTRFELVYLADSDMNFAAATNLVQKSFPESIAKESHSLYPKGAEHLLSYFRVRSHYEAETGGLTMEDFLLLRDGNQLYTDPDHAKLYEEWKVKPFPATGIRQRVQNKTASISFRTELLELTYPIFTYRHLPKKPPAIDSIERSPMRSNSKDLTP